MLHAVLQNRTPILQRWLPVSGHVLRDCCLRDLNAEFPQLPMNARSTPARIAQAHSPDEILDFTGYRWAAFAMPTLPPPVESEDLSMPRNHRLWLDDDEGGSLTGPQTREPNPQEPVSGAQTNAMAGAGALQDQTADGGVPGSQHAEVRESGGSLHVAASQIQPLQ
jgi:hypothetical protein